MTLAYTDVLLSSDSPFEPQKRIHFIFDVVIGVQSHHHSALPIMSFLPCFMPLSATHICNYPEGILKIRGGDEKRSILKDDFRFKKNKNTKEKEYS